MELETAPIGIFEWQRALRGRIPLHCIPTAWAMASYANRDGSAIFPGNFRLADDISASRKTVQRSMKWLRENGWIELARQGNSRAGMANEWRLIAPVELTEPLEPDAPDPTPFVDYRAYIVSPEWREKQRAYYQRYKRQCAGCLGESSLELHHGTYERLGAEELTDLCCLCASCHADVHSYQAARGVDLPTATTHIASPVWQIPRKVAA